MQKTIFTILTVVFLSVPLAGQESALPESAQRDSTEIGSVSEKEPAYRKNRISRFCRLQTPMPGQRRLSSAARFLPCWQRL